MKEYEIFLKKAIEQKNEHNSVNFIPLETTDRMIVEKLESMQLINNVRYIGMTAVGFDLTYDGVHYFDEQ